MPVAVVKPAEAVEPSGRALNGIGLIIRSSLPRTGRCVDDLLTAINLGVGGVVVGLAGVEVLGRPRHWQIGDLHSSPLPTAVVTVSHAQAQAEQDAVGIYEVALGATSLLSMSGISGSAMLIMAFAAHL